MNIVLRKSRLNNFANVDGFLNGGIGLVQVITATVTPATSAILAGESISDMTSYSAMIAPGNFFIDGVAVTDPTWVTVTFQGNATDAATAIAEGQSAGFTVTIDNGAGVARPFVASPYTVPDVTAPILSGASAALVDHDAVTLAFSTNEANGSAYAVATTSATQPSVAQIKAGQDHTSAAGVTSSSQAVNSTGAQPDIDFIGLPVDDLYFYLVHEDAAGNASTVYASGRRTTESATVTADTNPVMGALVDGAALASETGTDGAYSSNVTGETFVHGVDGASIVASYEIEGPATVWTATTAAVSESDVIRKSVVVAGSEGTTDTFTSASITVSSSLPDLSALSVAAQETDGDVPLSYTLNADSDVDFVFTTSATQPTAAQIAAGQDHTGSAAPESFTVALTVSGSPIDAAITSTALDASYYIHAVVDGGGDADVITASGGPISIDTTSPVLSSPLSSNLAATTADGSVTSDSDQGTLYAGVWPNAATPTSAQIIAGAGATYHSTRASPSVGANSFSATGLTASTGYRWHFHQVDDVGNVSAASASSLFTTTAGAPSLKFSDGFTRANEQIDANAGWTATDGVSISALNVVSNQLQYSGADIAAYCKVADATFTEQQLAGMTIKSRTPGADTTDYRAAVVINGGNEFSIFLLVVNFAAETIVMERGSNLASRSFAQVEAVDGSIDLSGEFTIELRRGAAGAYTAYVDGFEITDLAVTDTALSGGVPAVWFFSNGSNASTIIVDDFYADNN